MFGLVINLKTAMGTWLHYSAERLAIADDVI
jgi:hypothetical protein